ncbi:MAG: hypothetical protein ACXWPM_07355 [Bdellovibrionota bacterium]
MFFSLLIAIAITTQSARAAEQAAMAKFVEIPGSGAIPGLSWKSGEAEVQTVPTPAGGFQVVAIFQGSYSKSSAILIFESAVVQRSRDDSFSLMVPITEANRVFELTGIDDYGGVFTQKFEIKFPGWETFRKKLTPPVDNRRWWGYVELNALAGFQNTGAYVVSGELSWEPTIHLPRRFLLRADLGVSVFESRDGLEFAVTEYQGFVGYEGLKYFSFALGGGAQTWWGYLFETSPEASIQMAVKVRSAKPFLRLIDRVFTEYTMVLYQGIPFHEVKLGIGFRF